LGTKDYWDDIFSHELSIYKESGDVGEVWFGHDSVKRVADWLDAANKVSQSSSVLDIGCGNGMMLVELAKRGYTSLVGTDYSSNAIELARLIAEEKKLSIVYETSNVLEESQSDDGVLRRCYDLCLDKGTYDAVSLSPNDARGQRSLYTTRLQRLVKRGALFVITSCNWTKAELLEQFKIGFDYVDTIPTPTFQFGGKTGNKETVLVLRRINRESVT